MKTDGNWQVDLNTMTCRNTENEIVIFFEKKGPAIVGKIQNLPNEFSDEWMKDPNGQNFIRKAVIEADTVFFREYFYREIKRKIERMPA